MIDDETLMAYADGELDADMRAEVERALAADPTLAAAVEQHRRLRSAVSGAFAPVAAEPVPERLLAAVRAPAAIVDLAAARAAKAGTSLRPAARPAWRSWGAIAATLVVGIIAGQLVELGPQPLVDSRNGALIAAGRLAHALDTQLAAQAGGAADIGLSFRDTQGRYCRTFRVTGKSGVAGVACRDQKGWGVQVAVAAAGSASGGFRMASSETPPPVLAAVEQMIAGEPLDAAAEAQARAAGWR